MMPKDEFEVIDGSLSGFNTEPIAEFRHDDKTWYLNIDGEMISLPKILEQLNLVHENLNRSLSL